MSIEFQKSNLEKYFKNTPEDKISLAHLKSVFTLLELKNNSYPTDWISTNDISYLIYRLCKDLHRANSLRFYESVRKKITKSDLPINLSSIIILELKLAYASLSLVDKCVIYCRKKIQKYEKFKTYFYNFMINRFPQFTNMFSKQAMYNHIFDPLEKNHEEKCSARRSSIS